MFIASRFAGLSHVTVRVIEFRYNGMSDGNHVLLVFQHEREMNVISRTPYAPFAIDEALESLLHDFTAHVEITEREGRGVVDFQIGFIIALGRHDNERFNGNP